MRAHLARDTRWLNIGFEGILVNNKDGKAKEGGGVWGKVKVSCRLQLKARLNHDI